MKLRNEQDCKKLHDMATLAGNQAAYDMVGKEGDRPCGFAWIKIRPARGKYVNWLKANEIGRNGYAGGYDIPVLLQTQNLDIKEAFAAAYAEVLRNHGINANERGRMD